MPGEIKTVVYLDMARYSAISRSLEELHGLGVDVTEKLNAQIQGFVRQATADSDAHLSEVFVKSTGDGAILAFDEPSLADRFAEALQRRADEHNQPTGHEDQQRVFRVGIYSGDLRYTADGDVAGTVVGKAARLEGAARPGEILMDAESWKDLPEPLKLVYGPEEIVQGKPHDPEFRIRRRRGAVRRKIDTVPSPQRSRPPDRLSIPQPLAESTAREYLKEPGVPVVLHGPWGIGKSYLLDHLLRIHSGDGDRVVYIQLDHLKPTGTLDSFLERIGWEVTEQLGIVDEIFERAWESRRMSLRKLTRFLKKEVLPAPGSGRLLFALDRADTLMEKDFGNDIFAMLRNWADLGGKGEPWDRLRLLMTVSTDPALLSRRLQSSPFNMSVPIHLKGFDENQVKDLADRYGLTLGALELEKLTVQVEGHPLLIRRIFDHATQTQTPLLDLLETTTLKDLLGDYLRSRLLKIHHGELATAVRCVMDGDPKGIDPEVFQRLIDSGLVSGTPGCCRVRYAVYESFFRERLCP